MKKLLIICCFSFVLFESCQPTGDSLIWILEDGIEQIEKAKTCEEVSKITYKVKERMMLVGELPGGDVKMSAENTKKVIRCQNRFYDAVNKRLRELNYK